MSNSYFENGGPFDLRHSGQDEITMSLPIPTDSYGMLARECTDESCIPGYFKVKPGTGIVGEQQIAYCPYCRRGAPPSGFLTKAQRQYATDAVMSEAVVAVDRMIKRALKLGPTGRKSFGRGMFSISLAYKSGGRPEVSRPVEEELRRDLRCPHCTLEHAVFGLATWCPDCGRDVFETHLDAEFQVVRRILAAVEERRSTLGPRVAARDIENALEDTVSVFEAVSKLLVRRHLVATGRAIDEVDKLLERTIRSQFQNPELASRLWRDHLGLSLFDEVTPNVVATLSRTFVKRHPITHNLGVVDRKYLERVESGELHGREVRVSVAEVEAAIESTATVLTTVYRRLFRESAGCPLGGVGIAESS
jgi:hypothetical protein